VVLPHLRRWKRVVLEVAEIAASGADDEEAHPARVVALSLRIHSHKALVAVLVPSEQDVRALLIEHTPEWPHPLGVFRVAVPPRAEGWPVPVRQRAEVGMLLEIAPEPLSLRVASLATIDSPAVAVQDDDVPGAEVVAVVVAVVGATSLAEEIPVALRVLRGLIMVSGRGLRLILELSPRGSVALSELLGSPMLVSQVAEGRDRRIRILGEDARGCLVALVIAFGDVAGREQYRRPGAVAAPAVSSESRKENYAADGERDETGGDDNGRGPIPEYSPMLVASERSAGLSAPTRRAGQGVGGVR
jgi:hypothetical protein